MIENYDFMFSLLKGEEHKKEQMVSNQELQDWLGIAQRTVNELSKKGFLEKTDKNSFPLKKNIQLYVEYLRGGKGATKEQKEFEKNKLKLLQEKLKKQKLENLKLEGKVADPEDIDLQLKEAAQDMKDTILELPGRLVQKLKNVTEERKQFEIIEVEVVEILNKLHDVLR